MESITQKIKHGIKWQFITNILGQALYFINGVILARIMEPKDFGIYAMSQVLTNFIFTFSNMGLNYALIQKKEINNVHLNTVFSISLVIGILCFMVTWLCAPLLASFFHQNELIPLTRITAFTFIVYSFDRIPTALISRNLKFKESSLVSLANPIIYCLIAIPLALNGFGPLSFAYGVLAGAIGMMSVKLYWGFTIFKWTPKLGFQIKEATELLCFGIFSTLANITEFFTNNIQQILTGKFLGAVELGYYNRGSNLSYLPAEKVNSNINSVLLPGFSKIQGDTQKIRDWFRKFNFFTYALISPLLLIFIFFPQEVITGIFGIKWVAASIVLQWLSVSALLNASNAYFSNIIQSVGKPQLLFYINIIKLILLTIGLSIGLHWGIKGICIVLAIQGLLSLLINLFVHNSTGLIFVSDFILSVIEPVSISTLSGISASLFYHTFSLLNISPETRLFYICTLFSVFNLSYYFYRWFKKDKIQYLGFALREIVKI